MLPCVSRQSVCAAASAACLPACLPAHSTYCAAPDVLPLMHCRRYDASRCVDLRGRGIAVASALQDALGSLDVSRRSRRRRCHPHSTSLASLLQLMMHA